MSKKPQEIDSRTISELLVKEWADHYPPEKTSSLQAKAQSLTYTINATNDEYTKLVLAKSRLDDLTSALTPIITSLDSALEKRQDFISTYGDLGATPEIPYETMDSTLRLYTESLDSYAVKVTEGYFSNLKEIKASLEALTNLRNLYQDLAAIPSVIRNEFLKTTEDRRKPILRTLYRLFKSVAENQAFTPPDPSVSIPLVQNKIDETEHDSLLAARKEAKKFANLLKRVR